MEIRHTVVRAAALTLCAAFCVGQTADKRTQLRSGQLKLSDVLSWLPADTETVLGVNGPFPFPDIQALSNEDGPPLPQPFSLELRRFKETLPLSLLFLKNGGLSKALIGRLVALAVEGSRRFRSPTALGGTLYEGCEIAVFNGASIERDSLMKNVASSAVRSESIEGITVLIFEQQQEDDVWTTYVAFPRGNVVLVATNPDYLGTVLARMRGGTGPRALPDSLPEWKYVNTQAPAWGIRHYQRSEVNLDPTSPFQGQHPANVPDEEAIGVAFWLAPAGRRVATVTYLSQNRNARQILQKYLLGNEAPVPSRESQIRLQQPAPGVIQGSVALSDREVFYPMFFGLTAMLGHAIYL